MKSFSVFAWIALIAVALSSLPLQVMVEDEKLAIELTEKGEEKKEKEESEKEEFKPFNSFENTLVDRSLTIEFLRLYHFLPGSNFIKGPDSPPPELS